MRVRIPLVGFNNWYHNSWDALGTDLNLDSSDYERIYNVVCVSAGDELDRITHVEFPSEGEATMFLLRWS